MLPSKVCFNVTGAKNGRVLNLYANFLIKNYILYICILHCGRTDIWRCYGLSAAIDSLPETKKPEQKSDELPVNIRLHVKHVLSRELHVYHTVSS